MPKNRISPHDRFVKQMMTNPKVIQEFFETNLPQQVIDAIDLSSIQPQKDSFVDDNLRLQIADLLYAVDVNGEAGYVYLLLEHQSSPDKLLPFRMLKYMLAIMDQHMKKTKSQRLPFIFPLVLYTGRRPYPYTMDLFDLFGEQRTLAREMLLAPYALIDLTKVSDEELKKYIWFGTAAFIAKHIYDADMLPSFKEVIKTLKILDHEGESSYIYTIISYIFEAGEVADKDEFMQTIKSLESIEEQKIMTMVDHWKQEGFQKGVYQGKAEGKAEGKTEAAHAIAINLLKLGLEAGKASEATGISLEEIENLQKQIH